MHVIEDSLLLYWFMAFQDQATSHVYMKSLAELQICLHSCSAQGYLLH